MDVKGGEDKGEEEECRRSNVKKRCVGREWDVSREMNTRKKICSITWSKGTLKSASGDVTWISECRVSIG